MKSKLTILVIFIWIAGGLLFTSAVFAGGWIQITTDTSLTPGQPSVSSNTDEGTMGYWLENTAEGPADVPHLGLQTSTNQCRVCHAVHNGASDGFKLLRNNSRAEECNFCHGPNGALTQNSKKPYAPMIEDTNFDGVPDTVMPAKGEHTLGATQIPDSTVDASLNAISTDGLKCGNCHSVHGAWTVNQNNTGTNWKGTDDLQDKIVRLDPAGNGNGPTGAGAQGGVVNVEPPGSGNQPILGSGPSLNGETIAAFCGDCHNKNVNWDRGGWGANGDVVGSMKSGRIVSEGERPNKFAHPNGNVDGKIDVYGRLKTVDTIMWSGALTCSTCHSSRRIEPNKWPHQTVSHKLLDAGYSTTSPYLDNGGSGGYTGDPDRPLPDLDLNVCRVCHWNIGRPEDSTSF